MPDRETAFSKAETALIERIAKRDGLTFEEAANLLAKDGLAHRVRKKTGKGQAKVYSIKRRT